MICTKCGAQLPDGTKFCNNCGANLAQAQTAAPITGGETTVLSENARDWQYAQQNNSFVTSEQQPQQNAYAPQTGGETTVLSENARDWQYAQQNNSFVTSEQQPQQNAYTQQPQQNAYANNWQQPQQNVYAQQPQQNAYTNNWQQPQQNAYAQQPQQNFAQPQFEQPKKKKSKKGLGIGVAAVALVLVAAIVIGIALPSFKGFAVKTFGSPEDYVQYVEDKAIDSYKTDVMSVYGKFLSAASDLEKGTASAGNAQIKFNVGDGVLTMLESMLKAEAGMEIDLDWLNTVTIDLDADVKDTLYKMGVKLGVDKQTLADINIIMDMAEMEAYMAILNVSSKYIKLPLDSIGAKVEADTVLPYGGTSVPTAPTAASSPSLVKELMEKIPEIAAQLPSEKEMNDLIAKYVAIVTENIKEAEKSQSKVSIGEITETLTVLEFDIDTDTVLAIAKQVLETAKKDTDLKKYITKIADYLEKEKYIDDADEIYDAFVDAINEALENFDGLKDQKNEKLMTIVDYVNSKHEIVGRELKIAQGGPTISYLTVHKGNNFETLVDIPDTCRIEGEGTDKGDVVNGTYTLKVSGNKICEVKVADFDLNKLDEGYINGSFRIVPSTALLKEIGLDSSSAAALAIGDPSIEIKCASDKNSAKLEVSLLNSDKVVVGFTITAKSDKADKITIPSDKDTVDVNNMEEWLQSANFDQLIAALKKTSLPKDLVDMVESALKQVA